MAKFDVEQVLAMAACQQVINEWATELDINNGANIRNLVTEDVRYTVRGGMRQGRDAVASFYSERLEGFADMPGGVPTQRHIQSNFRFDFRGADEVSVSFTLVFFTTAGMTSGLDHADPAAVADVRMECRRGADGEWLIAMFDSEQTFRRTPQ